MKYKNIVWDWNGTLLNDLEVGVTTLNDMLERRKLPLLTCRQYKDKFGFPVADFYREVGFDLKQESLHDVSVDFVETYNRYAEKLELNEQVCEVLETIQGAQIKQYVLSALREDLLEQMVHDFDIAVRFDRVCGSDNIYAEGKIERGLRMLEKCPVCSAETLMVGDTVHDAEVARALGFDCILFAGGHNSEWRLAEKAPVIHQMKELLEKVIP
jgi:phosphoglycolate phosphatase